MPNPRPALAALLLLGLLLPGIPPARAHDVALPCPPTWDVGEGEPLPLTEAVSGDTAYGHGSTACTYGHDVGANFEPGRGFMAVVNWDLHAPPAGPVPCAGRDHPDGGGRVNSRSHQVEGAYRGLGKYSDGGPMGDARFIGLARRLVAQAEPLAAPCPGAEPFAWYDEAHTARCRAARPSAAREGSVEAIGRIVGFEGTLEIHTDLADGTSRWFRVERLNTVVGEHDIVRTATGARARIEFVDRHEQTNAGPSVITLGPETALCVVEFYARFDGPARRGVFELLEGAVRAFSKGWGGEDSAFSVRAGATVCGIRGTEVGLRYDPAADAAVASYVEGDAYLLVDGRNVSGFVPGTQVAVAATVPGPPVPLGAADLAYLRAVTAEPAPPRAVAAGDKPVPGDGPAAVPLAAVGAVALAAAAGRSRVR